MNSLAKPTLGFDRQRDAIRHLHEQGYGLHVIAHEVGAGLASVASTLSKLKLRPHRASTTLRSGNRPFLFLELSDELVPLLRPHAARRGLTCAALAAQIIDTVATAGLVDATLDDREG